MIIKDEHATHMKASFCPQVTKNTLLVKKVSAAVGSDVSLHKKLKK
jgi:hypothetical protein